MLFAARCKNNSASDVDTGMIEELNFPDFSAFMASFRKYKKDLSDTAKVALMTDGMEMLRNNELMKGLIERMFDYDREVDKIERAIFSQPLRMELTFNYIDLSFQLFPSSSDESFRMIAKYLHEL